MTGQIIVVVFLIFAAIALFVAVQKKWITDQTFQTLSNVAGVVALFAAIAVFIVPAPTNSDTEQKNLAITNSPATPAIQETNFNSIQATPTPPLQQTAYPTSQVLPEPTAFTVDDANNIQMENVNGKCDYYVPGLVVTYDDTSAHQYGITNSDGTVSWDLTQFSDGVVVGDAVFVEIDGVALPKKTNDFGITFLLTSSNPQERRFLRLKDGAFRIVPSQSGEGMLRLLQRNLECRGTIQDVVRYFPILTPIVKTTD